MTNLRTTVVLCLILLTPPLLVMAQPMGQHPMGEPPLGGGPPAFMENVFPPSLIMRHQADIGLTDAQRQAITTQMEDAQKSLVTLQWDVERESEKLAKLLAVDHIDETTALGQADQVMNAEERLKKAHLTLLIRIKNTLTPAQQAQLRKLRPPRAALP